MNGPLQEFTPDKSNYERPTLGWTCGRKAEGYPCHIGPSTGGHCQAHLECQPAKDGGGYVCSRPPAFGGKCEQGPLPDGSCCQPPVTCHPQRSLFGRRRMFSMTVAGLALGLLLCAFGGSAAIRNAVTSPGALTLQHTSSIQTCESCHDRADNNLNVLSDSLGSSSTVALTDSANCLKCHDFGPDALSPHSLSSEQLAELTSRAGTTVSSGSAPFLVSLANQLAGSPMDEGDLACSRCHKEHRGKFFDLKQMADSQCQVCHTKTFHGFNSGHPDFSGFPYKRRTRIHFDHSTHYGAHFANFKRIMPNGKAPESCESCHQPDPSHQTMPVVNFGQACGSCHGEQLDRAIDSIAFLALPQFDDATLQQNKPLIGEWPLATAPRMDDSLPAFTRLLLENDEAWANAMAEEEEDEKQVQVAWATKALIGDLTQNGREALQRRLSGSIGRPGGDAALISMLASSGSFLDRLSAASAEWFPNLQAELASHTAGQPPEFKAVSISGNSAVSAGWNTAVGAIDYLPTGHADRTVQVLVDSLVNVTGITAEGPQSSAHEMFASATDPGASFRCMACHTVDSSDEGTVVNWYGRRQTPRDRGFVRFSHAPHVTLLSRVEKAGASETASECAHCHRLEDFTQRDDVFIHSSFVNVSDWSANTDPHTAATSGFGGIDRQVCAACHTESRAGESCLKCHNYHVGHFANGSRLSDHAEAHEVASDEPGESGDDSVAAEE